MSQSREKIIKMSGTKDFVKVWPETNSWIVYVANFLEAKTSSSLFDTLMNKVEWQWEQSFFGHPPARKIKWFGDFEYTYSKKAAMKIDNNMPLLLKDVMLDITSKTNAWITKYDQDKEMNINYSGVLLNQYETGKHSISWHSDDEKGLKKSAPIASLSLGATRVFKMRALKTENHLSMKKLPATMHVSLLHGSLFLMGGAFQSHWEHAVEKQTDVKEPRINATFRHYQES